MFNIILIFVKYEIISSKKILIYLIYYGVPILGSHNSLHSYKYTFRFAYFITSYNNQVKIQFHKIEELVSKECKL